MADRPTPPLIPPGTNAGRVALALDRVVWEQLLVLADALEDQEQHLLALCFRWLEWQRRIPVGWNGRWQWRRLDLPEIPFQHQLPRCVGAELSKLSRRIGFRTNEASTMSEAYWLAAQALWCLLTESKLAVRDVVDVQACVLHLNNPIKPDPSFLIV